MSTDFPAYLVAITNDKRLIGASVVEIDTTGNHLPQPGGFEKAIEEQGDRVKAVILNYLHPTGVTTLRSRCRIWLVFLEI